MALLSFGGPAAQIAVRHRMLGEEKGWLNENRFLHALNYCMLLPGPEAQQLDTYCGWLLHGYKGGLTAGLLFILPGIVTSLILSVLYAGYGELPIINALFFGLKVAVLAIVIDAVWRIGQHALHSNLHTTIAAAAFIGIFFLSIRFPPSLSQPRSSALSAGRDFYPRLMKLRTTLLLPALITLFTIAAGVGP